MQTLFGTDGIRTQWGSFPLTPDALTQLGKTIGYWIMQKKISPIITIGTDTRYSKDISKSALLSGLLQFPVTVIDYGIIPTPILMQHTIHKQHHLGIIITASHNDAHDNGIKLFDKNGKLSALQEQELTDLFFHYRHNYNPKQWGKIEQDQESFTWYQNFLQNQFSANFLKNKKIIVDCANGAFSNYAPQLLQSFGAHIISLNTQIDGFSINKGCGALHPEQLQQTILKEEADYGFAFDGDGDRITIVTKKGTIKTGDALIALLSTNQRYKEQSVFVGTVMSNQGLEQFFKNNKKDFLRTPVGDKYISEKLKDLNLSLGGEPSGHIITKETQYCSDGLFTALLTAETLEKTSFTENLFNPFGQSIKNIPVKNKKNLDDITFKTIITECRKNSPESRILLRYSGTEPVLRVMVEAQEQEKADEICTFLCNAIQPLLQI